MCNSYELTTWKSLSTTSLASFMSERDEMVSTWHDQTSTQVQECEQVNCLHLLKHYLNQSHLSIIQNTIIIIPSLQNEKVFLHSK